MPLYEYQCPQCGVFEVIRRFADSPLTLCPKCTSPIEKLASAPAIQFKGSGWYVTDYARKSPGNGNGKDKPKDGAEGGKVEGSKAEGSKTDSSKSEASKGSSPASTASKDTAATGSGPTT